MLERCTLSVFIWLEKAWRRFNNHQATTYPWWPTASLEPFLRWIYGRSALFLPFFNCLVEISIDLTTAEPTTFQRRSSSTGPAHWHRGRTRGDVSGLAPSLGGEGGKAAERVAQRAASGGTLLGPAASCMLDDPQMPWTTTVRVQYRWASPGPPQN